MATITSVGTGAWSASGTWDSGVPADGDDVVIDAGHTVTFDVDQSGFSTGLASLVITGTLTVSIVTSSYMFMKAAGIISGAGTFNIGTSVNPIPFAVKFTLTGGAGWYINCASGLTINVNGTEPTYKYARLSSDEASGQTELSIDTDLTGDIWLAGDTVYVCDLARDDEVEERVIAVGGIASNTITITSALTNAKVTGAFVVLANRNVRILMGATNNELIRNTITNRLILNSGEIMGYQVNNNARLVPSGLIMNGGCLHKAGYGSMSTSTISDGTIVNLTSGISSGISGVCTTITGGLFVGVLNNVISSGYGVTVSGGIFAGNNYVFYKLTESYITGGTYISNNSISYESYDLNIDGSNCNFEGNKYMFNRFGSFRGYNIEYNEFIREGTDYALNRHTYHQSMFHNKVDGAQKYWCYSGIIVTQDTIKPDGYDLAYLITFLNSTYEVFCYIPFMVSAGETVNVEVQLRKDASMTYLPRVYLMNDVSNPLAGSTPVDSFTMTDSTDTWESDTFVIDNSAETVDKSYTLWFVAKNASDNAYAAYKITREGSGGAGSVKIIPLSGRVGL